MPRKTTRGAAGKSAGRSSRSREVLVVASKVKAYMKNKNMNTSADAINILSERVYSVLDDAVARSKANGRKTIKAQDI